MCVYSVHAVSLSHSLTHSYLSLYCYSIVHSIVLCISRSFSHSLKVAQYSSYWPNLYLSCIQWRAKRKKRKNYSLPKIFWSVIYFVWQTYTFIFIPNRFPPAGTSYLWGNSFFSQYTPFNIKSYTYSKLIHLNQHATYTIPLNFNPFQCISAHFH